MRRTAVSLTELKELSKDQEVAVNRIKVSSQLMRLEQRGSELDKVQILLDALYCNSKRNDVRCREVTMKVDDLLNCFQENLGTLNGEVYREKSARG